MNKRILSLLVIFAFSIPALLSAAPAEKGAKKSERAAFQQQQKEKVQAHKTQQQTENKAFREGLKGMTKEEKAEAKITHREQQHKENMEMRDKLYQENKANIQERLSKNKKLTDAEKTELLNAYDEQYKNRTDLRETQYKENMEFMTKLANDKSMTQEQKKAAIKEHAATQKAENKKFMEEQKAKMKTTKDSIKEKETETEK